VDVGAGQLPGAGRRDADEVEPELHPGERGPGEPGRAQRADDLGLLGRAPGEQLAHQVGGGVVVDVPRAGERAQVQASPLLPHGVGQRTEVAGRHHVDRGAHHPGLDDPPVVQCPGEVGPTEPASRDHNPT
jgi:hypothetical protein